VPEALRFVGLPSGIAANVRQMLYGAALILVIWLQQTKGRGAVNNTPEEQAEI
jgi:branched-chain amino acid transport system permease protein